MLPDLDAATVAITRIVEAVRAGRTVVVHCAGGLGRDGTIGGCVLVDLGASSEEALQTLRAKRSLNCPETAEQCRFIERYALRLTDPAWS